MSWGKMLYDNFRTVKIVYDIFFATIKSDVKIVEPTFLYVKNTNESLRTFRSSRPEVFCKKGVLRNFANCTGKHLCQSLFFNKEPAT